jgi:hypothetical protein
MSALAADQRDFKLTEVIGEPSDRARHGAHFGIGTGGTSIQ